MFQQKICIYFEEIDNVSWTFQNSLDMVVYRGINGMLCFLADALTLVFFLYEHLAVSRSSVIIFGNFRTYFRTTMNDNYIIIGYNNCHNLSHMPYNHVCIYRRLIMRLRPIINKSKLGKVHAVDSLYEAFT